MVLILIVVEDGLVLQIRRLVSLLKVCLNPYCSGRWSRTGQYIIMDTSKTRLNPYCSGRWSRTQNCFATERGVESLNPYCSGRWSRTDLIRLF